jgi:hypothetical protein
MQRSRCVKGRLRGIGEAFLLALILVLQGASVASAAKWNSCPEPPFPTYPSVIGATNSPFVHPGHDLTIVLNEKELLQTGGFSTAPDGNEVLVRFVSPFGPSTEMAPIWTDASVASLTFAFPAEQRNGEALVGPVEVIVLAGGRTVAYIAAEDLVALPPSNDVEPLLFGSGQPLVVLGAVGADGDVWIPVRINGTMMEKPTCPGDFIFPVSLQVAAAEIDADTGVKREPLRNIRGVSGYLGDVVVRDYSLYGAPFQTPIRLVHVASTLGVTICQLNDALDVVMRVQGAQSWVKSKSSPFDAFVRGCRPVPLLLESARTAPPQAHGASPVQRDSFDNDCSPRPAESRR